MVLAELTLSVERE